MSTRMRNAAVLVTIGLVAVGLIAWARMGRTVVIQAPEGYPSYRSATLPLEFSIVAYNVQARPWFDETEAKFPKSAGGWSLSTSSPFRNSSRTVIASGMRRTIP